MHLRVRFAETDQMRIAHHAAYVVWLEAARVEWLRDRGLRYRDLEEEGVSLAVAGLSVQYRAAARFDDELAIDVRLLEARSRRLRFGYRVERGDCGGRVTLALAETLHVPTAASGRAVRLPAPWLTALRGWLA
ncbi:MAG: acyl-CoA thioesterase [Trueperaceae bacterium]|nr:acyl-CoA thioesterase [Trueperaceae bacterium]